MTPIEQSIPTNVSEPQNTVPQLQWVLGSHLTGHLVVS